MRFGETKRGVEARTLRQLPHSSPSARYKRDAIPQRSFFDRLPTGSWPDWDIRDGRERTHRNRLRFQKAVANTGSQKRRSARTYCPLRGRRHQTLAQYGRTRSADFRAAWKPTVPASSGRPTTSEKPSSESALESSATE